MDQRELTNRDITRHHARQRREYIAAQKKADRIRRDLALAEVYEITKIMSRRFDQLAFSSIITAYLEGKRYRRKRYVKFEEVEITPLQYRLKIDSNKLPRGRGINEKSMTQDEVLLGLGFSIKRPVSYHIEPGIGLWFLVDLQHGMGNVPVHVDWIEIQQALAERKKKGVLTVCIGLSAGKLPVFIDLDSDTTAHFIVGGTTGGGKTTLLHVIICTLLKQSQDDVQLQLFDFKRVEFSPFYSGVPHLRDEIIFNPHEFAPKMAELSQLVDDRYRAMATSQSTHINQHNRRAGVEKMPRVVVVVDELSRVMEDPTISGKKQLLADMANIASMGRAAGIHMILSTQRPDKRVLPGLLRACCPARVAFMCANATESIVILGNGNAAWREEKPVGRAIVGYSRFHVPVQIAWITNDQRHAIAEDSAAGKALVSYMAHDVTIQELAQYALDNWDGKFKQIALFNVFKVRGVTRSNMLDFCTTYQGRPFKINGTTYTLEKNEGGRKTALSVVPYNSDNEF